MARALRILIPGAYYHVTCRGNERKAIFRDDTDRADFLEKLQGSLAIYQVELHAYVLMSNHFHLMVSTPRGNLSEFMRHFNVSYTSAYNRRHKRVGHLYQGRYKAILIDKDSYLLELSRYVHLNPVRIRPHQGKPIQEQIHELEHYRWSSLQGYVDPKKKQSWVRYDSVLGQIGESRKKYREFVVEGMRGGYSTPWEGVTGQVVLGEKDFVERVKRRIDKKGSKREQPAIGQLQAKSPEAVLSEVARYFGVEEKRLTGRRTGCRDERAVAMELIYRYGRISQAEIGKVFGGLDYTAVSRERKRLRERMEQENGLSKAVSGIEMRLS
jgi:REP element-mobilizing transposase RayT